MKFSHKLFNFPINSDKEKLCFHITTFNVFMQEKFLQFYNF